MKLYRFFKSSICNITEDVKQKEYYILSDEERISLQHCLISIYQDVIRVCEKYNLVCMLSGGSALGAVRHKGFIPWDDDMDLMMPRKDYNKLIEIFNEEMQEDYELSSPNSSRPNYFVQIIKKGTTVRYSNDSHDSGIEIDIFPIDVVPRSILLRYFLHYICIICRGIRYSIRTYKNKEISLKNVLSRNKSSYFLYLCLNSIGFLFHWIPERYWCIWCDKAASIGGTSKFSTIAMGRNLYMKETLHTDVFFPSSQGVFEGMKVNLPNNVDKYLSNLYGNYMEIPPENKREYHAITKFSINNK